MGGRCPCEDLLIPSPLASLQAGLRVHGVLARRNAVRVLIGAGLVLNAGVLVLVIADARWVALVLPGVVGQIVALFAITVAAAELGLALAIVLMLFRTRRSSDLRAATSLRQGAR